MARLLLVQCLMPTGEVERASRHSVEFPPVARCLRCGSAHCDGCESPTPQHMGLRWLSSERHSPLRLWGMACQSVEQPESWLPCLAGADLKSALGFAALAEGAAGTSLAIGLIGALSALAPSAEWSLQPEMWGWAGLFIIGFTCFMVALHVLWAVCLEALLQRHGKPGALGLSLGFGLYACGWDLLTSPAGLALAVATRGRRRGVALVRAATIAPRSCLTWYLVNQRGVSPYDAKRLAIVSFLPPVLLVMCTTLGLVWYWLA